MKEENIYIAAKWPTWSGLKMTVVERFHCIRTVEQECLAGLMFGELPLAKKVWRIDRVGHKDIDDRPNINYWFKLANHGRYCQNSNIPIIQYIHL